MSRSRRAKKLCDQMLSATIEIEILLALHWAGPGNYWIGPLGRTGKAFSPAIAIPSITSRAISSQKFPTGESAYFLRVQSIP